MPVKVSPEEMMITDEIKSFVVQKRETESKCNAVPEKGTERCFQERGSLTQRIPSLFGWESIAKMKPMIGKYFAKQETVPDQSS